MEDFYALCVDIFIYLHILNEFLVCTRSDWHKLESELSKNFYLFSLFYLFSGNQMSGYVGQTETDRGSLQESGSTEKGEN